MLEILSETKNPIKVQPHLKKCFEGINQLCFDTQNKIVAMESSENEKVYFSKHVLPERANGLVEIWIKEVEDAMRQSLNSEALKAIEAYTNLTRDEFIGEFPGQIVLIINNIFWTSKVTHVIYSLFVNNGWQIKNEPKLKVIFFC